MQRIYARLAQQIKNMIYKIEMAFGLFALAFALFALAFAVQVLVTINELSALGQSNLKAMQSDIESVQFENLLLNVR